MKLTLEKRREILQEFTEVFWNGIPLIPSDEQKAVGYFLAELKGMLTCGIDTDAPFLARWYFNDIDTDTL